MSLSTIEQQIIQEYGVFRGWFHANPLKFGAACAVVGIVLGFAAGLIV